MYGLGSLTNAPSTVVYGQQQTVLQQNRSMARLATGSASGASIASAGAVFSLSTSGKRLESATSGVSNALSFLEAQASGLQSLHKDLSRIMELTTLMQDPTKSADASTRENYMAEVNQLRDQMIATLKEQFNGHDLFQSSFGSDQEDPLTVRLGADGQKTITLSQSNFSGGSSSPYTLDPNLSAPPGLNTGGGTQTSYWDTLLPSTSDIRLTGDTEAQADAKTLADLLAYDPSDPNAQTPQTSISIFSLDLNAMLQDLADKIASNGSDQASLQLALSHMKDQSNNHLDAVSRIDDTDVAKEVVNLSRLNMQVETGAAMAAQANTSAALVLKLLSA